MLHLPDIWHLHVFNIYLWSMLRHIHVGGQTPSSFGWPFSFVLQQLHFGIITDSPHSPRYSLVGSALTWRVLGDLCKKLASSACSKSSCTGHNRLQGLWYPPPRKIQLPMSKVYLQHWQLWYLRISWYMYNGVFCSTWHIILSCFQRIPWLLRLCYLCIQLLINIT